MTTLKNALMGAAAFAILAGALPAQAQDVSWRATTIYPDTSNSGPAFEALRDTLAEETDGAFVLQLNPGGALGFKNEDNFEVVGDGVIEVAETLTGALIGVDPLFGATSLPFIIASDEEAQALVEAARPTFERIFEENDQMMLGWGSFPAVGIFAKGPATSLDEMAGVKLRTYDAFSADAMSTLGATPVQLAFSEVVSSLSSGVVDGVVTSTEGGKVISAWDLGITDFTDIRYSTPITLLHVSQEAFDELSAEHQDALRTAGEAFTRVHWEEGQKRVTENLALLEENGITIHRDIDPAVQDEIAAIRERVSTSWAEENGDEAAALLDAITGN